MQREPHWHNIDLFHWLISSTPLKILHNLVFSTNSGIISGGRARKLHWQIARGTWLCMAVFGWEMIVLLIVQPVDNISKIWRDSFAFVLVNCVLLYFRDLLCTIWMGSAVLWKRIHSHSYLPWQITLAVDDCVAVCSAGCSYFKILKWQFSFFYGTLA
jgi:hypothetical protein